MAKFDATERGESGATRIARAVVLGIAVMMSVYHLVTGYHGIGPPIAEIHYPVHLGFALLVLFGGDAVEAMVRRRYTALFMAILAAAGTILSIGYLVVNGDYVANRFNFAEPLTPLEMVLGITLIALVLEAARRTVGWVLVAVLSFFLIYAYFGQWFPGPLWHYGFSVNRIVELTYLTPEGLWNAPVRVVANFIFLFVLFGALLLASGAGTFFTDLARALTGRTVGGPAKTAVVASAFMGMLSGSSAANVVTTGSFTIPAMKQAGYKAEFAAGVEAVASTGGQFTPPIMGAAAFLMIEFVGVTYAEIMGFAVIPAFLFFLAVFIMVDLEARRIGLKPIASVDIPRVVPVLMRRGYLVSPVAVMLYFLFNGYTPNTAAFWAVVSLAGLILVFDTENRRRFGRVIWEALIEAPRMCVQVSVACAIGGVIAGIIVMGGLGLKVGGIILDVSDGIMLIALVLSMIVAIILGMGMPTSAAYIIMAALIAPGISDMGANLIAAHMFIIYCAGMSGITPPVAIASFAGAAIADTDPWRTSWVAIKLGLSVYIIPYMFIYGPALLGFGTVLEVATTLVTAAVGIAALSIACIGWFRVPLRIYERVGAICAAISLIFSGWLTDLLGFTLCAVLFGLVHLRARSRAA